MDGAVTDLAEAWDMGSQGVAWQKVLLQLAQAQVKATLAIAVELRGLRENRDS
jgi:hypothetical protein